MGLRFESGITDSPFGRRDRGGGGAHGLKRERLKKGVTVYRFAMPCGERCKWGYLLAATNINHLKIPDHKNQTNQLFRTALFDPTSEVIR